MTVKISKLFIVDSEIKGNHVVHLLILSATIFALYSSSLATVYLYADEIAAFSSAMVKRDVVTSFLKLGESHGRPLTGAAYSLMADAIVFGEYGLQGLRMLQFVLSLLVAIYVFFVMQVLRIKPNHALLLTIFLWSQPAVAVYHVYFKLAPYWLGVFCSLLAFSIFLVRKHKPYDWREGITYFVLFGIGLLTFQMTPFFFLGFLAFDILKDRDDRFFARHVKFFLVFLGTVALYTVAFKIVSELYGVGGYGRARLLLNPTDISHFFNSGYLFLFEFWNYLIPVEISEETKLKLLAITAVAWVLLIAMAVVVDRRTQKKCLRRWTLALACTGASFLPIVSDVASGRQHLFLATVPALLLLAYYAGTRIVPERWAGWVKPILVACLCLVVTGGSLGYQRGLVGPAARLFDFVQTEAVNQMRPGVKRILVIRPGADEMKGLCKYEPCTSLYGRRMSTYYHLRRRPLYRTVLRLTGLPSRLPIDFVDRNTSFQTDAITIDWYRFWRFEKQRGG
jgi:predicted membrane protein